jgi:hypothetical protein
MDPAVRALIDYLAERGVPCMPGLEDAALAALESELDGTLPDAMRALYRACGGMGEEALHHLPMRLMSPDEALDARAILRDSEEVYAPAKDARYLFTDDQSNWVGVFVTGHLTGKYAGRAKRRDIQGGGDPYTHWRHAVLALIAIGADDAVAAQRMDKPSNWPMPS